MINSTYSQVIEGRVIKLGDHIDTDLIYPGKYVPVVDPKEWPKHALEGIDPNFPQRIQPNDIIVAGRNFGCGSSRSQAVSCLKYAGIGAVVAGSFARIFFSTFVISSSSLGLIVRPSDGFATGIPTLFLSAAIPSIL